MRVMLLVVLLVFSLGRIGVAAAATSTAPHSQLPPEGQAAETWDGTWSDTAGSQGGRLHFVLRPDGSIDGRITNGDLSGSWRGFLRNDGVMFVDYEYESIGFAAQAIGTIDQQQDNQVSGSLQFIQNGAVFAEGYFSLTRSATVVPMPPTGTPSSPFVMPTPPGGAPTPSSGGQIVEATIENFTLPDLNITADTTVTWTNQDGAPHTATAGAPNAPSGAFDTGYLASGQSASITFNQPGEFAYFCQVHPAMQAVVSVATASPSP